MPTYDRLMNRPLVNLSLQAAELTGTNERLVLYHVSDRPSVMFASSRHTIYHSDRNIEQLPALFEEPDITVGITTNYYFDRLVSHSLAVVEINRQGGFVLFRMVPPTRETTEPPVSP